MDATISKLIWWNLEAHVDDIIVKTSWRESQCEDLEDILKSARRYNMNLNHAKCSFGVQAVKFLRFMLTKTEIEENPKKC